MRSSIVRIFAVCLLIGIQHASGFAQDAPAKSPPVMLKCKFTPGEVLRYKLISDITMPSRPGSARREQIRADVVFSEKTDRVLPNGDAEITIGYEQLNMLINGTQIDCSEDKLSTPKFIMSPNGAIKLVEGTDFSLEDAGRTSFNLLGIEGLTLPSTELKAGDMWSKTIKCPIPGGIGTLKVNGVLESASSKINDSTVAVLKHTMNGSFLKTLPNVKTKPSKPESGTVKGSLTGDSTVYFSAEAGRLIHSVSTLRIKVQTSKASAKPKSQPASPDFDVMMKTDVTLLPTEPNSP